MMTAPPNQTPQIGTLTTTSGSMIQVAHSSRLDVLRVGACLAVILLHLSATLVSNQTFLGTIHWHIANMVNAATRWCVPVFVMISGALMLDPRKHTNPPTFWKKRVSRLVPAILAWSAIYFSWRAYSWQDLISIKVIVHDFTVGLPFYHLYFLFLIAGLYMVTPFITRAIGTLDLSELRQLVLVMATLTIGATLFDFAYGSLGTSVFTLFIPYLAYYLAGWYCLHLPPGSALAYAMGIGAATAITTAMTAVLVATSGVDGQWSFYFYEHFSPTVMIAAVGIFLFVLYGPIPAGIETTAIRLAPLAFGVYLAHPLVIELLRYAYIFAMPSLLSPPYYVPVTFLLTCLLTGSLVAIMQRVPSLRRIV